MYNFKVGDQVKTGKHRQYEVLGPCNCMDSDCGYLMCRSTEDKYTLAVEISKMTLIKPKVIIARPDISEVVVYRGEITNV